MLDAKSEIGAPLAARGCVFITAPNIYVVAVAWQGVLPTDAADSPCGREAFRAANEKTRRVCSTTFQVATLGVCPVRSIFRAPRTRSTATAAQPRRAQGSQRMGPARQAGMTLVEPAIAMVVALLVLGTGATVFAGTSRNRASLERAIIFVAMRRGGRFLYAFDVTSPANQVMLWRKSNAHIPVLGQTRSETRMAMVKGHAGPVLVMGAGYDAAAEDATVPGTPTMGNAVPVLDAMTGTALKTLATAWSVPAAVALLDSDFDGYIDGAYAADTGANVYRIDFESAFGDGDIGNWRIAKFAALGGSSASRKFLHVPDLVQTRQFTAVLLGSGDREKPLAPYCPSGATTDDRFYTLLDRATGKRPSGQAPIAESQLSVIGTSAVPPANMTGCYLPLRRGRRGKGGDFRRLHGWLYVLQHQHADLPFSTNSCNMQLGTAKSYRVALFCGEAASLEFVGSGLPPSPVIGLVEVQVPSSDPSVPGTQSKQVPFIIGGFNAQLSGLQASRVPINVDPTRRRTYGFPNKGH